MSQDRRTFLKRSGAAISGAALGGAIPSGAVDGATPPQQRRLDAGRLGAIAEVVLPTELGDLGREEAVADFIAWADDFEPVAEQNHGYGTAEIRYGPPDPVPAWAAQLEALELEARQRNGAAFAELGVAARGALLEAHGLDEGRGMPNPLLARHVAIALMAHWFSSPAAVDRAYGRRIGERSCARGIDTARHEPEAVE